MKNGKKLSKKDTPEQISPDEALMRMKKFVERREVFVNAVKKSKDRGVSTG